ncbi:MAG: GNAT family N-acetyltransferase [Actinobacteria bacterium]|nr:GNAT family N-acetyltransferase [Actinomycetota bacterium]NIS30613.1 GNAT family N-acetyltransferase [Actinomycetota bacterium]NIT95175.1 GNAT family N-acetyltransferase [Actinomycetota bacterium]NIU18850.1 GNAT family N-acetyltransferase [Actinomycetota bacterium]NIU65819.1 GNAT family N-acetyltransferase [Actinomycetota bacterium]
MPSAVRHALPGHTDALVATLTEAFRSDPLQRHLFPDPDDPDRAREAGVASLMRAEVETHIPHGHLYAIGEGETVHAAALWTPPGVMADDEKLAEAVTAHADGETMAGAVEHFLAMFGARPTTPHFYLAVIGASDAARGRGHGSRLLQRVLDVCDAEGLPAALESTNPRNVSLYERHGFEVTAEVRFAPDVVVRPMTRQPR